ncbi:MAG: hypothetical protein U9R50_01730 [Campylobacterota bacterium]|nr:hypothetical protein [Campylobacterota bacterium]
MKNILLSIFILFSFLGCIDDNAYDGEGLGGGGDATTTRALLEQINREVLIKNSATQLSRALSAKEAITQLSTAQNTNELQNAQNTSSAFFEAWKKVEALYVAKKYDDIMIDLPAQIDYFHIGKGDLYAKLDGIYTSKFPLKDLLFQNSTKSITALEYTLYGHQEGLDLNMTQRRADAAVIMIEHLANKSYFISEFYSNSLAFVSAGEDSVGIMINQLIDSAYKLKEWRIGDPAGYTQKYLNNPDAERFEYYKSIRSLKGMDMILSAQLEMMQEGLEEIASNNAASGEAQATTALINDALTQVRAFSSPIENSPDSTQTRELYNTINSLQTSYSALIAALNFQQDIIEADGD